MAIELEMNAERKEHYIGIPWRDPEHWWLNESGKQLAGQMSIFDLEAKKNEVSN